jgi:phage-related protein
MSAVTTVRAQCEKMVYDFDSLVAPIQNAKNGVRSQKNLLQSMLNGHTGSAQSTVNGAITDLQSQVSNYLPGGNPEDMNALKSLIEQCEYLNGANPAAALIGASGGILNKVNGFVDNLSGSVPEFNIGKVMSALNDLFSANGGGLTDLVKKLDKLINCLTAFCGGEYPSQISEFQDTLNTLYLEMNINDNPASSGYGTFDLPKLMNDANIPEGDQDLINLSVEAIDGEKAKVFSSIESAVSSVKSLTGIGGFFPL